MKCRTVLNVGGTASTVGAIAWIAFASATALSCGQPSKTEGNSFNSEGSDAGGWSASSGPDSTGRGSEAGGAAIITSSTPTDGASAPLDAGMPTCASSSYQGKVVPVDMFIMMDQSGSMSDTVTGPNGAKGAKWDFLKQAFATFVLDPRSAGLGVGIQFFPIPDIDNSSCDAATYSVTNDPAEPASGQGVPIAPLPGNAAAIVASLGAHTPGGQTPTVAALTGAIEYATNSIAEIRPTRSLSFMRPTATRTGARETRFSGRFRGCCSFNRNASDPHLRDRNRRQPLCAQ